VDPVRWFKQLAFGRVNAVKARTKGKVMGKQAQAKSKAASGFNKGVDGAVGGAKNKVTGKKGKKKNQPPPQKKGGGGQKQQEPKKMGLFGRKKNETMSDAPESGGQSTHDATEMVDVDALGLSMPECVGWVVIWNGPFKGKDFRLEPGKNALGTDANCQVVLTDPYSSGQHAVIRYEDDEYTLVDLDSTNGTYLNQEKVVKSPLVDNDTIRIGRTEMRFKSLY
jgi:hypothetical protein